MCLIRCQHITAQICKKQGARRLKIITTKLNSQNKYADKEGKGKRNQLLQLGRLAQLTKLMIDRTVGATTLAY
jgi:hypothetical protein